jgi:hypothetical protein
MRTMRAGYSYGLKTTLIAWEESLSMAVSIAER